MERGHFLKAIFILVAGALFLGTWLYFPKEFHFVGETMGTTYSIRAYGPKWVSAGKMHTLISHRLEAVNHQMSTYRSDSEISRFNATTSIAPFQVSRDFYQVLVLSKKLYALCQGAWEPTIQPLTAFWKQVKSQPSPVLPGKKEVQAVLTQIGFDDVVLLSNSQIQKNRPGIQLDLSSIAKGFAVDKIADLLSQQSMCAFFIEIGGEIRVKGSKPNQQPWRIGISKPDSHATHNEVFTAISVQNQALATSGDYRNFFELGGKRYSHILDPLTGYPVTHNVVSVSVLSESCALSDGLATGLMVLSPTDGLALLRQMEGVEGMIVVREADGRLTQLVSPGFPERVFASDSR